MPWSLRDAEPLSQTHAKARRHESRRGWSVRYPSHTMVDEQFKLKGSVKTALLEFKRKHPFRLEGDVFEEAVRELYWQLAEAYGMLPPLVRHEGPWDGCSGSSCYMPGDHTIVLRGHPSVITALHEFTHARGYGEEGAVWWSVNVFRLMFPRSYQRLHNPNRSHVLVRAEES